MKWGKTIVIATAATALVLWLKENVKISVTCEVTQKEPEADMTEPTKADGEAVSTEA